jgi:hypothetical protein
MSTNANHKKKSDQPESDQVQQFLTANLDALAELTGEPVKMLEEFFENYHLKEVWDYLEEWFEAGITNELSYQTGKSRSNLIHFRKSVWKMTVAAYQLYSSAQPPLKEK